MSDPAVPARYLTLVKAAQRVVKEGRVDVAHVWLSNQVLIPTEAWNEFYAALDACLDEEALG